MTVAIPNKKPTAAGTALRFSAALWGNTRIVAAAMLAVGIPFVAFTNLTLFHFYIRGSFVLDSGLLASLMWHSDAALTQPASLGGASFLGTHTALLFLPLTELSWHLSFSMPQFFAGFVGASHALLALPVFWLLVEGFGMRRGLGLGIAVLAAWGFAFSGLSVAIARYPHFETLVAAFFLLFAVSHALEYRRLAIVFFVLGLATREDAGLHYAAILSLLIMLNLACGVALRRQRAELCFALLALAFAVAMMATQRLLFPGTSAFARVYLGSPPLAHLTPGLVGQRLLAFLVSRPYIVYPALCAGAWALRTRNPYLVLGFAANIPWTTVHLLAQKPLAGALVSYYAFPFLIALGWPLVGATWQWCRARNETDPSRVVAGFAAVLALSFVPGIAIHDPGQLPVPQAFWDPPSFAHQAVTDRAVAAIGAARPALGRLLVGNSIAALAPNEFAQAEVPFLLGDGTEGRGTTDAPDTVVFFTDDYDARQLRPIADTAGLANRYSVPGTQIHIAARWRLEETPSLGGLVAAEQAAAGQ